MVDIFRTIETATRQRMERIHSQFLGDALRDSIEGDRSLFDGVWGLCAPEAWETPRDAEILNELRLNGGQRIDLAIRDSDSDRVLGIEVKTAERSAEAGQLECYLQGLLANTKNVEDIAIAYLTPFNRERAERAIGDRAGLLRTVRFFDEFAVGFEQARHVSWLDVADIEWDGRAIWQQHTSYVQERMACDKDLKVRDKRTRALSDFFGGEAAEEFWNELDPIMGKEINGRVSIDLESIAKQGEAAVEEAVERLKRALTILIEADDSVAHLSRLDSFDELLRERFLKSACRAFHEMLFGLAVRFEPVWVHGKKEYGLRVANRCPGGKYSLVTSDGPGRLIVYMRK